MKKDTTPNCPGHTVKRGACGWCRVQALEQERDRMIRYLKDRCQQTCSGRDAYRGKLRHEPNCPRYDLDLDRALDLNAHAQ